MSDARERVVDYLWRAGPAPRAQVVRDTRLSRATVSKLVGELQSEGLVAETPAPRDGRAGRPESLLAIEPALGRVGGIDFGHDSIRVAVADLAGVIVAEARAELDVDNEPRAAIASAASGLRRLARLGPPLLGVGAAISAPVRRDSGVPVAAGILPGWSAVSLRVELERRLGVEVHVGNDANLGALAEVRAGAGRGAADVVYLMLSAGIGAGLVLGGELHTGHSGMTGELGHVIVDPGGAPCRCGHRGCLETVAGAAAVHRRGGGDRCLAEAGQAVGRVAGAVCNLVNPELVIVGGELIVAGDALVDGVRDGIREVAIDPVWDDLRVVAAELGDRAELEGAVGLALGHVGVALLERAAA